MLRNIREQVNDRSRRQRDQDAATPAATPAAATPAAATPRPDRRAPPAGPLTSHGALSLEKNEFGPWGPPAILVSLKATEVHWWPK